MTERPHNVRPSAASAGREHIGIAYQPVYAVDTNQLVRLKKSAIVEFRAAPGRSDKPSFMLNERVNHEQKRTTTPKTKRHRLTCARSAWAGGEGRKGPLAPVCTNALPLANVGTPPVITRIEADAWHDRDTMTTRARMRDNRFVERFLHDAYFQLL